MIFKKIIVFCFFVLATHSARSVDIPVTAQLQQFPVPQKSRKLSARERRKIARLNTPHVIQQHTHSTLSSFLNPVAWWLRCYIQGLATYFFSLAVITSLWISIAMGLIYSGIIVNSGLAILISFVPVMGVAIKLGQFFTNYVNPDDRFAYDMGCLTGFGFLFSYYFGY